MSLFSSQDRSNDAAVTSTEEKFTRFKAEQKATRDKVTFLRAPVTTIRLFCSVLREWIGLLFAWLWTHIVATVILVSVVIAFGIATNIDGPHQEFVEPVRFWLILGSWWIMLGVASSVGLGTGLHTFLIYLGPYIAQVTLAATTCNTLDFDTWGPDRLRCVASTDESMQVSWLDIVGKIWIEAFLWGAGTALGELPPYFVARQARLAEKRLQELEELEGIDNEARNSKLSSYGKVVIYVKSLVVHILGNLGFFGILLFAAIPNPLFDLAGLTSGHCLVPFWTFFIATFIGKAVIKVSIQCGFFVLVFRKEFLQTQIVLIEKWLPVKVDLQKKLEDIQATFLRDPGTPIETKAKPLIGRLWEYFIIAMVSYFIISVIESSVQELLIRRDEEKFEEFKKKLEDSKTE